MSHFDAETDIMQPGQSAYSFKYAPDKIVRSIKWNYEGATGFYKVVSDVIGGVLFFTKDAYQRDMFIAELKAKILVMAALK